MSQPDSDEWRALRERRKLTGEWFCEQVADWARLAWVRAAGEGRWVTRAELIVVLVKTGSAVTVAQSGLVPRAGSGCGAGSS